jgi:hypothetical protein
LVRSLYRDDKLSQPEIARRLDRHKSWVCRRLVLVEALDPAVQADVRLGLLAPRAAIALAALPRGNQVAASAVVIRRGLTVAQTERLVAELRDQPEAARAGVDRLAVDRELEGNGGDRRGGAVFDRERELVAMAAQVEVRVPAAAVRIVTLRTPAPRLLMTLGGAPAGSALCWTRLAAPGFFSKAAPLMRHRL